MNNQLKGEKVVTTVVVLEWVLTILQAIGLICYLKYLGDNGQLGSETTGPDPSTVLVWLSLGSVAYIILCIFLSALLSRGVSQKCGRHLSIWIIIQYIVFVLSFISVIATMIGYLGSWSWFWWTLILSLVYRFFILKIISEFSQEISLAVDKERRKSLADLRNSEAGSTVSAPAKLTHNNLQFHNSQYIPLPDQQQYTPPSSFTLVPPVVHQQQQPRQYTPPASYSQHPGLPIQMPYSIQPPISTISLGKTYHPQPPSAAHRYPPRPLITRSYSESTV